MVGSDNVPVVFFTKTVHFLWKQVERPLTMDHNPSLYLNLHLYRMTDLTVMYIHTYTVTCLIQLIMSTKPWQTVCNLISVTRKGIHFLILQNDILPLFGMFNLVYQWPIFSKNISIFQGKILWKVVELAITLYSVTATNTVIFTITTKKTSNLALQDDSSVCAWRKSEAVKWGIDKCLSVNHEM
jgi:hypothetical protein